MESPAAVMTDEDDGISGRLAAAAAKRFWRSDSSCNELEQVLN